MKYSYHGRIKQRIRNGELIDWYITKDYPRIGEALVLIFGTAPLKRPIRPHRYNEYLPILSGVKRETPT